MTVSRLCGVVDRCEDRLCVVSDCGDGGCVAIAVNCESVQVGCCGDPIPCHCVEVRCWLQCRISSEFG